MKKITFLIIFIIFYHISFGQDKYDSRLLVRYDKALLDKIAKETPGRLNWLNYHISHMYEIVDRSKIRSNNIDTLKLFDIKTKKVIPGEIKNINPKTFNPFLYNIKEDAKNDKYYLIPRTSKVVHIFPRSKTIRDYNKTIE